MEPSYRKYWWAEIFLVFATLTAVGAISLPMMFGRNWSNSLLPLITLPIQILISLFSFGWLFATRSYTNRLLLAISSVLILSILASFAMFAFSGIHAGSGHGP